MDAFTTWYNHEQLQHSTIGMVSPINYEDAAVTNREAA